MSKKDLPVLYSFWLSSCSWRARIALHLKGIQYEYRAIPILTGVQYQEEYKGINPSSTVPTLHIDGVSISQSLAIMEYLEERFPDHGAPLLPRHTSSSDVETLKKRALARQLSSLIACDTQPLQTLSVLKKIKREFGEQHVKPWGAHFVNKSFTAFERVLQSSSGRFCVGDQVSMADICLVPMVSNAARYDIDHLEARYPNIMRVTRECQKLAAFVETAPEQQPDAPANK